MRPALLLTLLALIMPALTAMAGEPARLVLVIDDIGNHLRADRSAVNLPGPVAMAILPGTPNAARIANIAHAQGKPVMVHLPMQAYPDSPLGPFALRMDMDETDFRQTVRDALAAVPHAQGLNNHMGSLLTRHPGAMDWLMDELNNGSGLFFLDSRTTAKTLTEEFARKHKVPWLRRHVFLDDDPQPEAVARQWQAALAHARRHGEVVVIGHPYPATLALLERELLHLPEDIELVAPAELLPAANSFYPAGSNRCANGQPSQADALASSATCSLPATKIEPLKRSPGSG